MLTIILYCYYFFFFTCFISKSMSITRKVTRKTIYSLWSTLNYQVSPAIRNTQIKYYTILVIIVIIFIIRLMYMDYINIALYQHHQIWNIEYCRITITLLCLEILKIHPYQYHNKHRSWTNINMICLQYYINIGWKHYVFFFFYCFFCNIVM